MNQTQQRRVVHGGAYGFAIFVRPPRRATAAQLSLDFERRAILQGYTAVIDGQVIEAGSTQAQAVIATMSPGEWQ